MKISQIEKDGIGDNYFITENGDVFSRKFTNERKLKQSITKNGYKVITITCNKKSYNFLVHRLVAMAFLELPKEKLTVNHKDGNKHNNHYLNLEWATMLENNRHARKLGLTKGVPHSEQTKKRLSEMYKGKYILGDAHNAKKVINKSTGEIFNCLKEAAINAKYNYSHFSEMMKGRVTNNSNYEYV
jgi:hypothetical protein